MTRDDRLRACACRLDDSRQGLSRDAGARARDWSVPAGNLEWDCWRTLDHIVDTLFLYAAYLASRGTERISPPRNGNPAASPAQLLATVSAAAAVLAEVARASPPG